LVFIGLTLMAVTSTRQSQHYGLRQRLGVGIGNSQRGQDFDLQRSICSASASVA
jgi:hypothetical protein